MDQDARPGVTGEESAEIKRLKQENAELKRANAILKAALVFLVRRRRLPDLTRGPERRLSMRNPHRGAGNALLGRGQRSPLQNRCCPAVERMKLTARSLVFVMA